MSESLGGLGVGAADPGIGKKVAIGMDRRAIANGWLKDARGLGLDNERMAALITRNYTEAMKTTDARALAGLTRNVIAAVGQVMEQERRDAGPEDIKLNVTTMSDDERRRRIAELVASGLRRSLELPPAGGAAEDQWAPGDNSLGG